MRQICDENTHEPLTGADEDVEHTLKPPPPKLQSQPPSSDWHADFLSLSAPAFTQPNTSDISRKSITTNTEHEDAEQQDNSNDVDGGDISDSDGDDDDDDDGDGEVEDQDDAISSATHRYFGAASDSSSSEGDSENENDEHGNVPGACMILRIGYQSLGF